MARLIQVVKFVVFVAFLASQSAALARKASHGHSKEWANTITIGKESTTTLQFYFHDTVSGRSPSAIQVAHPLKPEYKKPTGFGTVWMADDPFTVEPNPKSKLVGRAQGLYASAGRDELNLLMALSYVFLDGKYNGSTMSIMGRNSAKSTIREMPVVGGTGFFRMARGYAQARLYWFDSKSGDAIVGYNVTVFH